MQFRVIRPFRLGSVVRMPGQIVEMELVQGARLRAMGLVGNVPREQAVAQPMERAVAPGSKHAADPPRERRKYKPRKVKTFDDGEEE